MSLTTEKFSRIDKVIDFNQRVLGIKPRRFNFPPTDELHLSYTQLVEEAAEFRDAYENVDLADMIDAILDSLYFSYGILYKLGLTEPVINEMFEAIHNANMQKTKGVKSGREGFDAADAIKSEGWQDPKKVILGILKREYDYVNKTIIVEGPNGAGKSTLIQQLSNKFERPIFHATKPSDSTEALLLASDEIIKESSKIELELWDRSHSISRLIYQFNSLSDEERGIYEAYTKWLAANTIIIYCIGKGKRDTNKPHYNDELIKETSNQTAIRRQYNSLFSNIPHIKYNFEVDTFSSLLSKLDAV
jgi:hypothetical protein